MGITRMPNVTWKHHSGRSSADPGNRSPHQVLGGHIGGSLYNIRERSDEDLVTSNDDREDSSIRGGAGGSYDIDNADIQSWARPSSVACGIADLTDQDTEETLRLTFEYLDTYGRGRIDGQCIQNFFAKEGIQSDDMRIKSMLEKVKELGRSPIDLMTFKEIARSCSDLCGKLAGGTMSIRAFKQVSKDMQDIFTELKKTSNGEAKKAATGYDSDSFAVSLCSVDGQRLSLGDSRVKFTVEGLCKPVLYCVAVEERDGDEVHEFVGHEPSGRTCNAIVLEEKDGRKRPHNPLITSGGILVSSLVTFGAQDREGRVAGVLKLWEELMGITPDAEGTKVSMAGTSIEEMANRNRNHCLAYLMKEGNCFEDDSPVDDVIRFFEQNCSVSANTDQLAVMAATLANGGICPITGTRVFDPETVHDCLSLMYACGMYEFSGEWAFSVGVPAKSSQSGAVLVVVPGVMGCVAWSPKLDDSDMNSIRGVQFFEKLIERFTFHNYDDFASSKIKKIDPGKHTKHRAIDMQEKLMYAAAEGDIMELRRLVADGVDLDIADYDNRTALHIAASEGRIKAARYLIRHGVNLSVVDRWGSTPLQDAEKFGHTKLAVLLKKSGADRANAAFNHEITSQSSKAPLSKDEVHLFHAAAEGDLPAVQKLAGSGVNLSCKDNDGRTPLHIAAGEGSLEIVQYLRKQGVEQVKDRWGALPQDVAHSARFEEVYAFLADCKVRPGLLKQKSQRKMVESPSTPLHRTDSLSDDEIQNEDESEGLSLHSAQHYYNASVNLQGGGQDEGIGVAALMRTLDTSGLGKDDVRLKQLNDTLRVLGPSAVLTPEQYKVMTENGAILLEKAVTGSLKIPDFQQFCQEIMEIYNITLDYEDGAVADYIPQLANVDPNKYGVAICTTDGQIFTVGDVEDDFCVQSCSKPITYCVALEENGLEKVHQHVGREPSGRSFNELSLMAQSGKKKPHNPMINAGAIMCSSLVARTRPMHERFEKVMKYWRDLCGKTKIGFNNSVYLSERDTADRNFCLGYMMHEAGAFPDDGAELQQNLEFYFQQCSITVTAKQMAVLAGTLANGGVCPITSQRVFKGETVKHCLSLMYSCGMYDYSGEWAFKVGVPAKSGVAGAVFVVIPNVMGICTWSPRLDSIGNSVRGVEFFKLLLQRFNFHNFDKNVPELSMEKRDPVYRPKTDTRSGLTYKMLTAAKDGELDELHRLVVMGCNIDADDYDGRTALHLAASEGRTEIVKYLVLKGAAVEKCDRWGNTPEDDAISGGYKSIVDLLRRSREEAMTTKR